MYSRNGQENERERQMAPIRVQEMGKDQTIIAVGITQVDLIMKDKEPHHRLHPRVDQRKLQEKALVTGVQSLKACIIMEKGSIQAHFQVCGVKVAVLKIIK